jgi:hypothetical protein
VPRIALKFDHNTPVLTVELAYLEEFFYSEMACIDPDDVPGIMGYLLRRVLIDGECDPASLGPLIAGYDADTYCGECEEAPCVCNR